MKVILIENVPDLGQKYDVKEVKPGYARNFLIPNGMVKAATKANLKWLEKEMQTINTQVEEELKMTQDLASRLDGIEVRIAVKVGEGGQLFESINSVKIAEQLKEMGYLVKKNQIDLKEPIKTAGDFPVSVHLDHNLEAEITVVVTGESEA